MLKQIFIEMQVYDSIMCGYFCIGIIHIMLKGKKEYTYLFSPNDYKNNYEVILKYLQ